MMRKSSKENYVRKVFIYSVGIFIVFILFPTVLTVLYRYAASTNKYSAPVSFIQEALLWATISLSTLLAILSFLHFYLKRDLTTPLIVSITAFSACLIFLCIVLENIFPLNSFVILHISWVLERLFVSIILLFGGFILIKKGVSKNSLHINTGVIVNVIIVIFGVTLFALVLDLLHRGWFLEIPFSYLNISTFIFFALSLYPIWKLHKIENTVFSASLFISVIPAIIGQLFIIIIDWKYSASLAYFTRLCEYTMIFIGFCAYFMQTFYDLIFLAEGYQEANIQKDRLISVISHDLRNPLAIIKESINLFSDIHGKQLDDTEKGLIDTARENIAFMLYLINDLLDMTKLSFGKIDLRRTPTDINQLIHQTITGIRLLAERKSISIIENFADNLSKIQIDPNRITRVIHNLISNAIKFSYKNSRISIETQQKTDAITVTITDAGCGISPENLEGLLSENFLPGKTGTGGEKSTGLGFFIVKNILDLSGATLKIDSEEQKGTVIEISFPQTLYESAS